MQSRDFVYWLQGYFEIAETDGHGINLTPGQIKTIQKHLNLVFAHEIDPAMGSAQHQEKLNDIHFSPVHDPSKMILRC